MNQALYRFWQTITNGDARAKGEYPNPADTDNYEIMLKEKIFDPIMTNKAAIKVIFLLLISSHLFHSKNMIK